MQQQQAAGPDTHSGRPGVPAVSPESVQAALQQQQMALLQSAHAAVQANLIPPHLIAAVPSLNPTVASKLQRLVQLVDVHQKLGGNQAQLPPVPGYPASADFNAVIKQQIVQLRQEVVLALTSSISIPPPPLASGQTSGGPAGVQADMMRGGVQSAEDMAASSRLSQWKQPTDVVGSSKPPPASGFPSNGPLPSSTGAWPAAVASVGGSVSSDKTGSDSGTGPGLDATTGVAASSLEIEEFVPGKPWQGPSMWRVEDDPYMTPGSVSRSAISAIDDAHVMNVLGSSVGPGARGGAGRPAGGSVWSAETEPRPLGAQTPGAQLGRSISWAPGDRANAPSKLSTFSTVLFVCLISWSGLPYAQLFTQV